MDSNQTTNSNEDSNQKKQGAGCSIQLLMIFNPTNLIQMEWFMIELEPLGSLTLGVHDDPAYSHNLWTQDHPGRSP